MSVAAVDTRALLQQAWALRKASDAHGMVNLLSGLSMDSLRGEIELAHLFSWGLREIGEFRRSLDLQLELEPLFRMRGNDWLLRWWLLVAGTNWQNVGNSSEARNCYSECLHLADSAGDQYSLSWAANNLGTLELHLGSVGAAAANFQHAIAANHRMGYLRGLAFAHHNLVILYTGLGRYDEAMKHAERATDYARLLNNRILLHWHDVARAEVFIGRNDTEPGKSLLRRSLSVFLADQAWPQACTALTDLGTCYRKEGAFSEAQRSLSEALGIARRLKARLLEGFALAEIAIVEDLDSHPGGAGDTAQDARVIFLEFGSTYYWEKLWKQLSPATRARLQKTALDRQK